MIKQLYKIIALAALIFTAINVSTQQADTNLPAWALGPFVRPSNVNPIISPDTSGVFFDPMHQQLWHWESNDTFNPAATVKDGKIYVLYRSEDNSGKGIGERTSRVGLAE